MKHNLNPVVTRLTLPLARHSRALQLAGRWFGDSLANLAIAVLNDRVPPVKTLVLIVERKVESRLPKLCTLKFTLAPEFTIDLLPCLAPGVL